MMPPPGTTPGPAPAAPLGPVLKGDVAPRPVVDGFCWKGEVTICPGEDEDCADGLNCPAAPPSVSGWKSSLVIGSLYFFRRNRCSTRTSRLGGLAFANLRLNSPMACAY